MWIVNEGMIVIIQSSVILFNVYATLILVGNGMYVSALSPADPYSWGPPGHKVTKQRKERTIGCPKRRKLQQLVIQWSFFILIPEVGLLSC
jgi:hypothetical protein